MLVFSGIRFRMNQAFVVLSDSVIHCIHLGFVTIPPKDTLIHFESEHKLSTVEKADCIIVIDKGQVQEQGTHMGLLKEGGMYSKLVSKQLHAFETPVDLMERVIDNVKSYMPEHHNMFSRNSALGGANNSNNTDGTTSTPPTSAAVIILNSIAASYGSLGSFHSAGSLTLSSAENGSPSESSLRTPLSVSPHSGFEST